MTIKRIILSITFIFASTNLIAEQSLTLEQRLLIMFQKYHMGDRQWIFNGIIAALPVYYATKNVYALYNFIMQQCASNDMICSHCGTDTPCASSDFELSMPGSSAIIPSGATPVAEVKPNIQEPRLTAFHFGFMSSLLILVHAAMGVYSSH